MLQASGWETDPSLVHALPGSQGFFQELHKGLLVGPLAGASGSVGSLQKEMNGVKTTRTKLAIEQ